MEEMKNQKEEKAWIYGLKLVNLTSQLYFSFVFNLVELKLEYMCSWDLMMM